MKDIQKKVEGGLPKCGRGGINAQCRNPHPNLVYIYTSGYLSTARTFNANFSEASHSALHWIQLQSPLREVQCVCIQTSVKHINLKIREKHGQQHGCPMDLNGSVLT